VEWPPNKESIICSFRNCPSSTLELLFQGYFINKLLSTEVYLNAYLFI
jgi:hypothetical protein